MSLKRRLSYTLLFAIVLTLLSLLYRTGPSILEPMPYSPDPSSSPIIDNGVCAIDHPNCFDPNNNYTIVDATRGWPLRIVSLSPDDDAPLSYYRGLEPYGLLGDLVIFYAVSFPVVWLFNGPKKVQLINGRPVARPAKSRK